MESDVIDLIEEYPKKFFFTQRQHRIKLECHFSFAGEIKSVYGDKLFAAPNIILSSVVTGHGNSFMCKGGNVNVSDDKLQHLKDINESSKRARKNQEAIINATKVYLKQHLVRKGRYITHVHAKEDIPPNSYVSLIGGNIRSIPAEELVRHCSNPKSDLVYFLIPLKELGDYYLKKTTGEEVTVTRKLDASLHAIEGFEVDERNRIYKMWPTSFIKYARSSEKANVFVKAIRCVPGNSTKGRIHWYLCSGENGIKAHEKLLLPRFWDEIPEYSAYVYMSRCNQVENQRNEKRKLEQLNNNDENVATKKMRLDGKNMEKEDAKSQVEGSNESLTPAVLSRNGKNFFIELKCT